MPITEATVAERRTLRVPFPASLAVEPGDLCYWDDSANLGKPATSRTDTGSKAGNQADFAPLFLGVSADKRLSSETSVTTVASLPTGPSDRLVVTEGIFDVPCASAAFEFGDWVGIDRDSTPLNTAQQLIAVTDPRLALGFVVKREPTAVTKVRVFLSAFQFGWFANKGTLRDAQLIGASTAAAGSTYADAGALPAGTAKVYPTSAADDTKGVILHANDQVTGRVLYVGNNVSNKILKVYGPAGAVINGAAANAGFSSVSGAGVVAVCLSGSGNTWLMF